MGIEQSNPLINTQDSKVESSPQLTTSRIKPESKEDISSYYQFEIERW